MAREVVVKCSIPREDYNTVIGVGGGNVYALGIEHSVSILLPGVPFLAIQPPGAHRAIFQIPGYKEASPLEGNPDSRNVDILIRGKAENCQRAKKGILGLLPVVTEAVIVPYRFRNVVLGPHHENIETISDQYGVRIEFPPLLLESEFVHIVGPNANCSKASDALVKRVRELKIEEGKNLLKQRETIKLASECHNHIIRSRLATMAKIREEHDVEIFFNYKENLDLHIHEVVIIGRGAV